MGCAVIDWRTTYIDKSYQADAGGVGTIPSPPAQPFLHSSGKMFLRIKNNWRVPHFRERKYFGKDRSFGKKTISEVETWKGKKEEKNKCEKNSIL